MEWRRSHGWNWGPGRRRWSGLPRLEAELGLGRLLVKRDDLTGLALGGNKTRKLEYLVAEARAGGADTLITTGAAQSNHAGRQRRRRRGWGCGASWW